MRAASAISLSLTGPYRPNRQKLIRCAVVLLGLLCFRLVFKKNVELGKFFASIEKTAGQWSTGILESKPWSKMTSKLQDWRWENDHAGEDSIDHKLRWFKSDLLHGKPPFQLFPDQDVKSQAGAKQQQQTGSETYTLATFKKAWLENEIGEPLASTDLTSISNLCDSVSWYDDIVLDMASYSGGIGDLRVQILNFIYFAIQTGSHIILPPYINSTLETSNLADDSNGLPFSQLFDAQFLTTTLADTCPQMQVFQWAQMSVIEAMVTERFDIGPSHIDQNANSTPPKMWIGFRDWIATSPDGYRGDALNLVTVGVPLFNFDMRTKHKLRMALGRLIKFNYQIREVAAMALFNLRHNRNLEAAIDPWKSVYQGAYYGVNLPTQDDAASTWPLDEAQKRAHLRMCKKLNLNLIYVATGNHQDAAQFAKEAHEMGISVISKFDLLSKIEKQSVFDNVALGSLSLAQKSAVGFEILSRSSFYSGPADNSFTWNVAFRRAFHIEDTRLDRTNAYAISQVDPTVVYDDGLSRVDSRAYSTKGADMVELYAPKGMYP